MSLPSNSYVLLILLTLAVYFDLTQKKIPNFLTFPAMVWGLVSYTVVGWPEGFLFSFYGLLLGCGLFLLPFALGGLGGGDVKLLGAVGALQGSAFVFHTALFTAICGGVMAVAYLAAGGRLRQALGNAVSLVLRKPVAALSSRFCHPWLLKAAGRLQQPLRATPQESPGIPYGVAIALGTMVAATGAFTFF